MKLIFRGFSLIVLSAFLAIANEGQAQDLDLPDEPSTTEPADLVPHEETNRLLLPALDAEADTAVDGQEQEMAPVGADSAIVPFSVNNPQKYKVAGVKVTGSNFLDPSLIASVTGLHVGQEIVLPGDGLADAVKKLWNQHLFANVKILIEKIQDDNIYLNVAVTERPRLANFNFRGIKKGEVTELKDKLELTPNSVITGNTTLKAIRTIKDFFAKKGYGDAAVKIVQVANPKTPNTTDLTFVIDKGDKVKVNTIFITGNEELTERELISKLKGTKEQSRLSLYKSPERDVYGEHSTPSFKEYLKDWGPLSLSKTRDVLSPYMKLKLFSSAKFKKEKYKEDKETLLEYFNEKGFRDAEILEDTFYQAVGKGANIAIKVKEGRKYYYGDITWKGNTQYPDSVLNSILDVKKGDTYNLKMLNERLGVQPTQDQMDISSLYQDNGYLFFNIIPVETRIYNDTIDYEMRMVEGPQADINRILVSGNDKTNDHVLLRELRTIPGDKYSKQAIMRSMRQIQQLDYFDPQAIAPDPRPNPGDGTVDIGWGVEEKPSDKLELSAGWGGYFGITGTVGMTFNNFSLRNITDKKSWRPLPSGDGQTFSVQVQSNGRYYSSYNFTFVEPWLGGRKRNPFSVSYYHNKFSNADSIKSNGIPIFSNKSYMTTTGVSVSYGKQLNWPDDFFSLSFQASYERFRLKNYFGEPVFYQAGLTNGVANNINLRITLDRNSTDRPDFPTQGSHFSIFGQFTPPYSLFEDKSAGDYEKMSANDRFKFIEYQKYRLLSEWYFPLGRPHGKDQKTFTLKAAIKMGFVGRYNSKAPLSPFERFELGGDGISNYIYYGKDIISQRGYEVYYDSDPTVNPDNTQPPRSYQGFTMFNKYTLELRYPLSLNPSATIIGLVFAEAGNGYEGLKNYNPFELRRSVGVGARFKLPMFGLLGFDYGLGIDRMRKGQGLKNATKFSFMLGYEPD